MVSMAARAMRIIDFMFYSNLQKKNQVSILHANEIECQTYFQCLTRRLRPYGQDEELLGGMWKNLYSWQISFTYLYDSLIDRW